MTTAQPRDGEPEMDWAWTDEDSTWIPPEIDIEKPSPARMYDYSLGGKDNFEVDRKAVEQVATVLPDFRHLGQMNRRFLVNSVTTMAEAGVRQFIDIGTGIPTSPNVHEIAREVHPDARIVYVDNDPIVMAHNRALRSRRPGVLTLQRDLRQPSSVMDAPEVRTHLDLNRPVGLLLVAVLHFVRRELAIEVVNQFRRALPAGSYLAISTACAEADQSAGAGLLECAGADGAAHDGSGGAALRRHRPDRTRSDRRYPVAGRGNSTTDPDSQRCGKGAVAEPVITGSAVVLVLLAQLLVAE
jgi:S-adenosyl methyltransferase